MVEAEVRKLLVEHFKANLGQVFPECRYPCSEPVRHAYVINGMEMPERAWRMFNFFKPVKQARPGDLHFHFSPAWGTIIHVLMDAGDGQVVHLWPKKPCAIDALARFSDSPNYRGPRRHPAFEIPPEDIRDDAEVAVAPGILGKLGGPLPADQPMEALIENGLVKIVHPVDHNFERVKAENVGEWVPLPVMAAPGWKYDGREFRPW